ncbi:MAG: UDP-N-acetylglucosamine 2-epimerase (non-hydrolyzing) [Proteobacteria bacterium]|nr:UDP-N-acetylglucosamine 2-epimerase (non-hydrolyzing) [Pseudomonadota bacterium]
MKKLKVVTVIGTRPEIIRLSRVMACLDRHCEHVIVHTGQNYDYELNQVFLEDLEVRKPDHFLNSAGDSAARTIGNVIINVDGVLERERPEALLVLGDTNSCFAVIPAKRRRIPIFHMEAGNRCFDQRVPEEINRRIIDHTADVNLTYSSIAREYLLREGLPADMIIKTGSPMFEVLDYYRDRIEQSDILDRLGLTPAGFFLVSAHREENVDDPKSLTRIVDILNALAGDHDLPVVVSTHPRTRKRMDAAGAKVHPHVRLLKPFGFSDYVKLQLASRAVLSDSGTINEEASILNIPALNLREAHERPEGMEEAAVMMVGLELDRIRQGLAILAAGPDSGGRYMREVADYTVPNVSEKVVRIVHSYTDYINRVVWREYH